MYKRIVLLQSTDEGAVAELLQELHAFPGKILGLKEVEIITDKGDRSKGFNQGFILTFEDESVLPSWRDHPLHAEFRPRLRELCQILIFDYEPSARFGKKEKSDAEI